MTTETIYRVARNRGYNDETEIGYYDTKSAAVEARRGVIIKHWNDWIRDVDGERQELVGEIDGEVGIVKKELHRTNSADNSTNRPDSPEDQQ